MSAGPDLYVVFDGPPSHESGRFVEVEDAYGRGVNSDPADWSKRDNGLWVLGAFKAVEATDAVQDCRVVLIRGDASRLTVELVNDAIGDLNRGGPRLREHFFGLKDYDRFRGQRSDHPYGMGPRHGHTAVAIELAPALRGDDPLSAADIATATAFLAQYPRPTPEPRP